MGFLRKLFGMQASTKPGDTEPDHVPAPPPFSVPARFSIVTRTIHIGSDHQVSGESYRQDAIDAVAGPRTAKGPSSEFLNAQLALDPSNPHDPDAVAVYLGQAHVGYIERELAPMWHNVIRELQSQGHPTVCHVNVTGGWSRAGDDGYYGLVLWASSPPRRMVASDPVIARKIGRGSRVSVQGEEHCQDYLFDLFKGGRSEEFVASLSINENGRVAAHHLDQLVGQMTPKMSTRYGALVQLLEDIGWPVTCNAMIEPGKKKLEVSLKLPTGPNLTAACVDLGLAPPV